MPRGIAAGKRRQRTFIPGKAAYKRAFISNHYKKKGLDFSTFMLLVMQDCHYCGQPPSLHNPYGSTYPERKKTNYITEHYWNNCWISYNGIDKKVPSNDYSDVSNLLPCCTDCNWLKGTYSYEEFLIIIKRISSYQKRLESKKLQSMLASFTAASDPSL